MKLTFLSLIAILLLTTSCKDSEADIHDKRKNYLDSLLLLQDEIPANIGFLKTFKGKFMDDKDIEMVLIKWDDGYVSGKYWYPGSRKAIELNGETESDSRFQILEGRFGNETGIFDAELVNGNVLRGFWSSMNGTRQIPFELSESVSASDTLGWSGNWYFNDVWDNGVLMIGNVRANNLDFALSITKAGHQGSINGTAKISGSKAVFRTTEFDDSPCILTFDYAFDHITVEQNGANFSCGFGARAYAGGRYDRIFRMKKAFLAYGPEPATVFPNKEVHDAFLELVGKEPYHLFAFNMQTTEAETISSVDNISGTAVSGFVPGLLTSNEAIIIYDQNMKFWAATIFFDRTNSESLLVYFTNDARYKNKLPETIDNWREGFQSYRVIYH